MSAVSLIHRYNRLNGNSIGLTKLKEFRAAVERHLDSVGHGPYVPDLKGILGRVNKLIKQMTDQGYEAVGRVELVPIDVREKKPLPKKEKRKAFTPKSRGKKKSKPRTPEVIDKGMLHGLECIQNDAHLNGEGLGEVGSTTYKVITDKILALMDKNGLIWRKPWNENYPGKESHAHNYVTKRYYRGTNYYLNYLLVTEFKSPYFFTFNQVNDRGGSVRKGQKGWPVIYFKYLYKDMKKGKLVDEREATANGKLKPGYEKFPALFYYLVWNADQCEGLKLKPHKPAKITLKEKIESCERIVDRMPKRPKITSQRGDRAFYQPSTDSITVPLIEQFKFEQQYYSVLFHEMVHSTGAAHRIGRDLTGRFGSKSYAFEELIAELGASYLCGESGVLYHTMDNSAAYVKNWSSKLREEMLANPKFFLKAAAAAEKASEFILDREAEEKTKPAPRKKQKKDRKPVAKKAQPKKVEEQKQAVPKSAKIIADGLGFITADQDPGEAANTFVLPGEIGKLLGTQQAFKLTIVISGETHSSKSQLGMQIADAFAESGYDVAWLDWEQGGLQSKDTKANLDRNTKPANRKRIHVSGTVPRTREALANLAKKFKVIALDSGTKLKETTNAWIDELREQHPDTIWIIMMQQNEKGGTRGGTAAEFDSPVLLKTYRPDKNTHETNYAEVEKNRGNKTGLKYWINQKKLESWPQVQPTPPAPTPQPLDKAA